MEEKIDVDYVARLARLRITDEEAGEFQGQLENVMEYMRKIKKLDLSGIEPTSHAHAVNNVFRGDEVRQGLEREEAIRNAPVSRSDLYIVPRIVEE